MKKYSVLLIPVLFLSCAAGLFSVSTVEELRTTESLMSQMGYEIFYWSALSGGVNGYDEWLNRSELLNTMADLVLNATKEPSIHQQLTLLSILKDADFEISAKRSQAWQSHNLILQALIIRWKNGSFQSETDRILFSTFLVSGSTGCLDALTHLELSKGEEQ